jgi:predicted RNA polymerase sigma factor
VTSGPDVEESLRRPAPRVLAALVRRYGDFETAETAEDAAQEALPTGATRSSHGVADHFG